MKNILRNKAVWISLFAVVIIAGFIFAVQVREKSFEGEVYFAEWNSDSPTVPAHLNIVIEYNLFMIRRLNVTLALDGETYASSTCSKDDGLIWTMFVRDDYIYFSLFMSWELDEFVLFSHRNNQYEGPLYAGDRSFSEFFYGERYQTEPAAVHPQVNEEAPQTLPQNLRPLIGGAVAIEDISGINLNYVSAWNSAEDRYFRIETGGTYEGCAVWSAHAGYALAGEEMSFREQRLTLEGDVAVEGVLLTENGEPVFYPGVESMIPFLEPYNSVLEWFKEIETPEGIIKVKNIKITFYNNEDEELSPDEPRRVTMTLSGLNLSCRDFVGERTMGSARGALAD